MANKQKCALTVCTCLAVTPDVYCSDYCQEAATHGIERDFCQCAHAGCISAGEAIELTIPMRPPSSEGRPAMAKAKHA
jgi:hypothetical protein